MTELTRQECTSASGHGHEGEKSGQQQDTVWSADFIIGIQLLGSCDGLFSMNADHCTTMFFYGLGMSVGHGKGLWATQIRRKLLPTTCGTSPTYLGLPTTLRFVPFFFYFNPSAIVLPHDVVLLYVQKGPIRFSLFPSLLTIEHNIFLHWHDRLIFTM